MTKATPAGRTLADRTATSGVRPTRPAALTEAEVQKQNAPLARATGAFHLVRHGACSIAWIPGYTGNPLGEANAQDDSVCPFRLHGRLSQRHCVRAKRGRESENRRHDGLAQRPDQSADWRGQPELAAGGRSQSVEQYATIRR